MRSLSQAEREHNSRALVLGAFFTVEMLAEFLHQTYRAADKAMNRDKGAPPRGIWNFGRHDHGFSKCHRKDYFLRRARMFLKEIL